MSIIVIWDPTTVEDQLQYKNPAKRFYGSTLEGAVQEYGRWAQDREQNISTTLPNWPPISLLTLYLLNRTFFHLSTKKYKFFYFSRD